MSTVAVRPPAVPKPPAVPVSVPAWRGMNTLQTLWASLYLIWALDALLLFAAITGARVHRDAIKTVGKDTVPSIIAAQHIKSAMADMDASVANELLGKPGEMQAEVDNYEKRRIEASDALIMAAQNITYGEAERKPIIELQKGLGKFEGKVERARVLHERGETGVVEAYRDAAQVMDQTLLPEADLLDKANYDMLDAAYRSHGGESMATVIFLLIMGFSLLGALGVVQMFLNRTMHRILNPLLVLATLLTVGFVIDTLDSLSTERHELKVAKEDAFTSIHALWRARAVAYSANADESRYLLDRDHWEDHEKNFNQKALKLAAWHGQVPDRSSLTALTGNKKVEGFTGFLADELGNLTFEGEGTAAKEALGYFIDYAAIDREIRQKQTEKKFAEALQLCIGNKQGESNWVFDRFDKALGDTLKINQDAFDESVAKGFGALDHFELKASVIAIGIALLAFFGILQRIREYR